METAALRRDAVAFARCLLTQTASRGITEAGSWAHTEYCYWARYFDEITFQRVYLYNTHYYGQTTLRRRSSRQEGRRQQGVVSP